jgi:hypothetical protein
MGKRRRSLMPHNDNFPILLPTKSEFHLSIIEDGKLNYTGLTVRGKADRLTFIEGGKDAWWYEKK